LFVSAKIQAQYYTLSNKPQLTQKKHFYHTVIGENEYGVFTVNYTNDYFAGGFSIEKYDRDLGFQDDRVFDIPKKAFVLDVFLADSQICWVSVIRKRRENLRLYISKVHVSLSGDVVSEFLGHLPLKTWIPEDIKFSRSTQVPQWSVALLQDIGESKTAFWAQIRQSTGALQAHYFDTIPEKLTNTALGNFSLGAKGELMAIVRVAKTRSVFANAKREQQLYFFRGSSVESGFREWQFDYQVQSTQLVYDNFLKRWLLLAWVGEHQKEALGYSWIQVWDAKPGYQQVDPLLTDIEAKILDGEIKAKKRNNPMNYVLRRMIPRRDGGVMVLLERYIELKQLETFYINGIPQTATKVLYNYNEIGVLILDSSGFCDTALRINKEQTAAPVTAYLLGFGSFVCENGVHLVYNDDISKNNEIKEVVIRPDAEIEEHLLLNSDNFYNVVVPFDGLESEYCTFTLPLLRDKQWFWMQVKNRD